jgi:adenine specific DNA methylase Mod
MHNLSSERLGYPTQKPLALLERLIAASSNPGDVILDPFCGCGTTVEAAHALERNWVGIDVTHYAISLIEARMKKTFAKIVVNVEGRPGDYAAACDLAARSKYQFQWWANWLLQVQDYRERKKGPDRGIDGTIYFPNGPKGVGRVIVSVKGGENLNVSMVRDLHGTMAREGAEMGVVVTLNEPTAAMQKEARQGGIVKTAPGTYQRIQLLWIKEWFEGKRPDLPRPFEPAKLRLTPPPKKAPDDKQLGFTFTIPGGRRQKRKDEVVYTDPRVMFSRE